MGNKNKGKLGTSSVSQLLELLCWTTGWAGGLLWGHKRLHLRKAAWHSKVEVQVIFPVNETLYEPVFFFSLGGAGAGRNFLNWIKQMKSSYLRHTQTHHHHHQLLSGLVIDLLRRLLGKYFMP